MKNNVWAKTILTCYRYLEKICDAIDRLVEAKAVNSFYVSSATFYSNGTLSVADKIIELSQRKVTLINLKVMTENALEQLSELAISILTQKYIDGRKAYEIAQDLNLSNRTYFRRLDEAESEFLRNLNHSGFNTESFMLELKKEKWIMQVYNQFKTEQEVHISMQKALV